MTESEVNLNEFNKLLKECDFGRTYLFSIEIDNDFPFDITHLTAYCRSINFINRGKTIELQFILIKKLWDAFEILKPESTLKLNVLNRNNTPLLSQSFLLPVDSEHKSITLDKFSHSPVEGNGIIPVFKVYFDL